MDRITPSGEPGSVASGLINAKGKSIAVTERLHKALRLQHLLDEKVRLHSRISRHSLVSLFSAAGFLMPDIRNNAVLLGGFTGFLLRHAHQAALSMQELRVFKRRYMPEIRFLSKTLNVTNPRKYVDDKVETLKPDEKREFMMTSLRNEIRTLEEREDYLSEYAFHCDKSTIIYIAGSLLLSTIPHDLTVALSGAMTSIGCTFMLDGTVASVTARLCREKAESLMKRLDGVWHERTDQS